MKKTHILVVFLISFSTSGQENELVGVIKQNSGQSFLMSLNFFTDSLGTFTGTTTVDPFGPFKTITSVKGIIQDDVLVFTEIGNIETRIKDTSQRYCFINTNELVATIDGEISYYKGTYIGYDINSNICSEGEIQLSPKSSLKSKTVNNQTQSIAKRKPKSKVSTNNESYESDKEKKSKPELTRKRKIINSSEPILLHESIENLRWGSKSLKLHIKDSYNEDSDSIAIIKNGELISEIELSKKGDSFSFGIEKNPLVLRLTALNEGLEPPTTLDIMLYDEYCIYRSSIRLEQNQWTEIILIPEIYD